MDVFRVHQLTDWSQGHPTNADVHKHTNTRVRTHTTEPPPPVPISAGQPGAGNSLTLMDRANSGGLRAHTHTGRVHGCAQ